MNRSELAMLIVLGLAAAGSGIAVVYTKYISRMEFADLQSLRAERHDLEVQWGRLRLEEATLTTHARVEQLARRNLDMHLPVRGEVRVITGGTPEGGAHGRP